jgi:hypothetical protein
MMQSIQEHQQIPKGEAAGMPVGGTRKRRRVWNLTVERRQKPKERTRGYCGSRRKLAAACRKVSCGATVAWRKRNIRKIWTQGNCEPRKEFAAAGIRTALYAKVACARNEVMKDRRSNKDDGRIRPEINLQLQPEKDGCSGRDVGWIRKAALV